MNASKFTTGSIHYIHLADPSEESISHYEEDTITTLANDDNPLATKLTTMASRGIITSEEFAQLAVVVNGR